MAVRVVVAADATAVTQSIDRIKDAIEKAGQAGKQFADLDLSHPELAGTADDIRKVQSNLENLLKARGSTARDARSIFGSGDILDFLEARERIGRKFGTPDEAARFTARSGRYVFDGTRFQPPEPPPPPPPPPLNPSPKPKPDEADEGKSGWAPVISGAKAAGGWMLAMAGVQGIKQFATAAYQGAEGEAFAADQILRRTPLNRSNDGNPDPLSVENGGMAVTFDAVRDAAQALTKGLQISSTELLRYASAVGAAGSTSTSMALNLTRVGVGEARDFGADPGSFMRAIGNAVQLGFSGEKFAGILAETISQSGMAGRTEEVLQTLQNWVQQQSRVSLTADSLQDNTKSYADMFVDMQNGSSPALWGANAASVMGQLNSAITAGGGGGMAGQALTYRAMLGAGVSDPYQMQMDLAGGAFDKTNGKANFQIVIDELKKEYGPLGDPNRMALAAGTYFNMNPRTAQALLGMNMGGVDTGALDGYLKPYGGIMGVNPTALGDLAKARTANRDELDQMRTNLMLRTDVPDELKGKGSALFNAQSDDDLRKAVTQVLAQSGMDQSPATKLAQSNADLANQMAQLGRPLLEVIPALKDVFAGLLSPLDRIADWTDRWLQKEDPVGWAQRNASIGVAGDATDSAAGNPSFGGSFLSKTAQAESRSGKTSKNLYGFIDGTWWQDVHQAALDDPGLAMQLMDASRDQVMAMRNDPTISSQVANWHQRHVIKPILDKAHIPATELAMYAAWHYQNAAPGIMRAGDDVMMKDLVSPDAYAANLSELQGITAGQWRQRIRGKGFSDSGFNGTPVSGASGVMAHTVTGTATVVVQTPDGKRLGAAAVPLVSTPNGAAPINAPKTSVVEFPASLLMPH